MPVDELTHKILVELDLVIRVLNVLCPEIVEQAADELIKRFEKLDHPRLDEIQETLEMAKSKYHVS